jgi:hypothetical protein
MTNAISPVKLLKPAPAPSNLIASETRLSAGRSLSFKALTTESAAGNNNSPKPA